MRVDFLKNSIFLAFILLCCYFSSHTRYIRPNTNYSYYVFAVQRWCGQSQPNTYDIHGLWPQYNSTAYPTYCTNVTYDPNMPQDMLNKMNDLWNTCENNTQLWEHEWKKHGSCFSAQTGLDQITYFNTALNIYDQIQGKSWSCSNQTDCIIACVDLDYRVIDCPNRKGKKFKKSKKNYTHLQ